MKLPYMPFFPADWLTDNELRGCSLAARGLWIDLICLAWKCNPRGVLASGDGAWSDEEIARRVGARQDDTALALAELLRVGVAHRNESGAIFSRRLVRDEQIRRKKAKAGQKGGLAKARNASKRASKTLAPSDYDSEDEDVRTKKEQSAWELAIRYMSGCALKTDKFRAEWEAWRVHRKEIHKPLTPTTIQRQVKLLESFGHDGAIATIDQSIRHGWQGLFEPRDAKTPGRSSGKGGAAGRKRPTAADRGEYPEDNRPLPAL